MGTVTMTTTPTEIIIPEAYRDSALRYIEAIAKHDQYAFLGPEFVATRSSELWDQFVTTFTALQVGPYARHGQDAVRIALGRL